MRNALRGHWELLANAASLIGTTAVTSALGFAYWALAARYFRAEVVGYASATVSAMSLLSTLGTFGLGTMLIGELPRRGMRPGLISAALLAAAAAALTLAVGFAVISPHASHHLGPLVQPMSRAALFAAGVVIIAVGMVFDYATIGLLRGGLQLSRNVIFAVGKLPMLLATVSIIQHDSDISLTLPWVGAAALSLALVALRLRASGIPVLPRPNWRLLRGLGKTTAAHSWLNLSLATPSFSMPVLVTVVVSPAANAAFYAAWMLANILYLIPAQLALTLYAVASADAHSLAGKLRFTLRLSLLAGLPAMACLGLGARIVLNMYGPGYARQGTFTLCMLVLGYLPMITKVHYLAVCRATGRVSRAAALLSITACAELTAAAAGGVLLGLKGLSVALLAVYYAEGLLTAPAVLRIAMRRGRHSATAPPLTGHGARLLGSLTSLQLALPGSIRKRKYPVSGPAETLPEQQRR